MRNILLGIGTLALATGCVTTPTTSIENGYAIYNIEAPFNKHNEITKAITEGAKTHTSEIRVKKEIPPHPLPQYPGRFQLTSIKLTGNFAALAANFPKQPSCKGSMMDINAVNTGMSSYGEETRYFMCLMPYEGGFHLDVYTTFTIKTGGFSTRTIGADIARSMIGDSSQFMSKTLNSIVEKVNETGLKMSVVEVYP